MISTEQSFELFGIPCNFHLTFDCIKNWKESKVNSIWKKLYSYVSLDKKSEDQSFTSKVNSLSFAIFQLGHFSFRGSFLLFQNVSFLAHKTFHIQVVNLKQNWKTIALKHQQYFIAILVSDDSITRGFSSWPFNFEWSISKKNCSHLILFLFVSKFQSLEKQFVWRCCLKFLHLPISTITLPEPKKNCFFVA